VVSGERERLIPFIREQVVLAVDAEARRIEVDWDPDF
jgi:16S rRNA processing protein RimM